MQQFPIREERKVDDMISMTDTRPWGQPSWERGPAFHEAENDAEAENL